MVPRARLQAHLERAHYPKSFECPNEGCNRAYGSEAALRQTSVGSRYIIPF